jgi:16S rRNA (guanine1207-N2)-methyltransferase
MSHYFSEDNSLKSDIKKIVYRRADREFVFTTDSGLFSKDRIDHATDILLGAVPPLSGSLLDMGCGYGCIGIVLAKIYSLELTQSDVNRSAVELTKINCEENGINSAVIKSNCFDDISGFFDTIIINPPIHAGKSVTYRMYEDSVAYLNDGGRLYVVTLKKHGAESTRTKLKDIFGRCKTIYKKRGYYVFCCEKLGDRAERDSVEC